MMVISAKEQTMPVVHPHAAGIDIGSQFYVVAVSSDKATESVRTFQSFTTDLHEIAKWLKSCGILFNTVPLRIRAIHMKFLLCSINSD